MIHLFFYHLKRTFPPKINMITLMQAVVACSRQNELQKKSSLISHTTDKQRMSTENLLCIKLFPAAAVAQLLKMSMHQVRWAKQAAGLENIISHSRSQIKNNNQWNGPHFPGCGVVAGWWQLCGLLWGKDCSWKVCVLIFNWVNNEPRWVDSSFIMSAVS